MKLPDPCWMLVGRYGTITYVGDNKCRVVNFEPDNELVSTHEIELKDLPLWVERLKIIANADGSIKITSE
jgi:hypothetical protein